MGCSYQRQWLKVQHQCQAQLLCFCAVSLTVFCFDTKQELSRLIRLSQLFSVDFYPCSVCQNYRNPWCQFYLSYNSLQNCVSLHSLQRCLPTASDIGLGAFHGGIQNQKDLLPNSFPCLLSLPLPYSLLLPAYFTFCMAHLCLCFTVKY